MEKRKEKSKNIIKIIGILLVFSGLCIIIYDYTTKKNQTEKEEKAIEEYYKIEESNNEDESTNQEEQTEVNEHININYIAILKIPKIGLERGLVDPNSYLNNVNYNVQIVNKSSMPDEEKGNVILAAHSGNSRVSYFRNLDKLTINDKVMIDYKGKTYTYSVVDFYDIEKTGTASIFRNYNKSTLTLITCRHNTSKQIVIICELIN